MSKKNFIGILGGTFDPPHKGHLFISNYAMKRLDLGEVWWIVTKKNPLKFGSGNFKKRLKSVKSFLLNRNIQIVEIHNEKKICVLLRPDSDYSENMASQKGKTCHS